MKPLIETIITHPTLTPKKKRRILKQLELALIDTKAAPNKRLKGLNTHFLYLSFYWSKSPQNGKRQHVRMTINGEAKKYTVSMDYWELVDRLVYNHAKALHYANPK